VHLEGTRKGYAGLMDKVYYKEVYFDLLYHIWFQKFFLHIVKTRSNMGVFKFKKIQVGRFETPTFVSKGVITLLHKCN